MTLHLYFHMSQAAQITGSFHERILAQFGHINKAPINCFVDWVDWGKFGEGQIRLSNLCQVTFWKSDLCSDTCVKIVIYWCLQDTYVIYKACFQKSKFCV